MSVILHVSMEVDDVPLNETLNENKMINQLRELRITRSSIKKIRCYIFDPADSLNSLYVYPVNTEFK